MTEDEYDFFCVLRLAALIGDDEALKAGSRKVTDEEWRAMNEFADSLRKYMEQGDRPELSGASAQ